MDILKLLNLNKTNVVLDETYPNEYRKALKRGIKYMGGYAITSGVIVMLERTRVAYLDFFIRDHLPSIKKNMPEYYKYVLQWAVENNITEITKDISDDMMSIINVTINRNHRL